MRCYQKMNSHKNKQLLRERMALDYSFENCLKFDNRIFTNFTSNDYLGIRSDLRIKEALVKAASHYGLGSGSSAHISGYYSVHRELEEQFASFLGRDKAIYFGSGYLANIGAITAVTGRNEMIFMDRSCHASIIDAVILSRAKFKRYEHNNTGELNKYLQDSSKKHNIVVTESIFSMEGDIVKVEELISCTKNKATLIIDDAHGGGVLGENGAGICEKNSLSQTDVPLLINGLGKAFGSYGAIVSGKKEIVDVVCQFARTYMYSTALPPIIPSASLKALEIIRSERWRREKLFENIKYFNIEAKKLNLKLISEDETPIKSILIPNLYQLRDLIDNLNNANIFVSGIRPPTVSKGLARVRVSLNVFHSKSEILSLLNIIRASSDDN